MSEDAEAERVARWLDADADASKVEMLRARANGWTDSASYHETRERLARKFAQHIREGKHRGR